jgi:LysR family transcriptional regulator, benzoate and cis,cis-muconate-responsive activator of ben and cat genes
MIISMNIKSLAAFVEVAEQAHFGRAAQNLGITQSGLSQMIKKLEQTSGAKLIARTTRTVSLTEVGEIFLEHARELLLAHELFSQRMGNVIQGDAGTVRLGFVASAALGILPELTAELHKRAPGIKLSLVELTSEEQLPRLRAGEIDVGVLREITQSPGLEMSLLLTEPLLLAVPKTHALASQKSVTLDVLKFEGFIMFPRTKVSYLHDHIYRLCNSAGFTPQIVEQAVQFATILGLVSSNAGVAIVPRSLTAIQLPNVKFLEIDHKDAFSRIYLARRMQEKSSPAAKKMVEIATDFANSLKA